MLNQCQNILNEKLFSRKIGEKSRWFTIILFISFSAVKVMCYLPTISIVTDTCNYH